MLIRSIRKRAISSIVSTSLVAGLLLPAALPTNALAAEAPDTSKHWASKEIRQWTDLELIQGYEDGSFRPDASIGRAEFMALVNRAFGFQEKGAVTYSDVQVSDWFSEEVGKASAAGYITGYEDGTIKPLQTITRQEVAVVLNRLLKLNASDKPTGFKDASEIPNWSRAAIHALSASGYMSGYPDQSFRPQQSITRAETVAVLHKANPLTRGMKAFDQAGTYQGDVKGHVVVQSPNVRLENMTIDGNLVLADSIGEGDALLKKVTVKGKTLVKGGGPNSVIMEDSTLGAVTVNKANGNVRLVANGSTTVQQMEVHSGVKLEGDAKNGYGSVQISKQIPSQAIVQISGHVQSLEVHGNMAAITMKDGSIQDIKLDANSTLKVEGGTVENFVVTQAAGQAAIELGAKAVVKSMTIGSNAQVSGGGTIESASITGSGAELNILPKKLEVAEGIQIKVGGKEVTSSNVSAVVPSSGTASNGSGEENRRPSPPAGLTASTGHQYVKLNWTAHGSSEVAGYNVYLNGTKLNTALISKTNYTHIGLTNGQKVSMSVTAVSNRGKESLGASIEATPELQGNIPVQLLSINDLHGKIDQTYSEAVAGYTGRVNIGRIDYTAAYLRQREETNPYTLMVQPGDLWGGSSPVSALLQDEPTIEIVEALGFDVGTLGNHEFDEGTQEMLRMVHGGEHPKGTKGYDGISFPVVAANVKYKSDNKHVVDPYVVKEIAGVKIGFIGVVTEATPGIVIPDGITDIQFTNAAEAVNEAAAALKQQGIKAIVVLAHLDAEHAANGTVVGPSAELAQSIDDEIDVIFAAHNHKIVNGTVDNKLIVQGFEYGKAIVDVDLEIDPTTKDIVKKQGEIVHVVQQGITPDAQIAAILAKYEQEVAPKINAVVGDAATPLLRGEGGTSGYVNQGDHPLGNLIADGMKWAMQADFALMNGGGIRDNLTAGPITWGKLFNIQPFNNVLVKFTVTGEELERIMNSQISQYGADYSIAGFKYKWDRATSKVTEMKLMNDQPVDKNQNYTVVVNNFMFSSNKTIAGMNKLSVTGPEDIEATVAYVKSFGRSISEADFPLGRVVKLNGSTADAGKKTLAEARALPAGSKVTIEGVAVSQSGGWGSKGFYIQDATGGAYVYQNAADVAVGDQIRFTGTTASFAGEFQLNPDSSGIVKVGTGAVPLPAVIEPGGVHASNQGTLVKLVGVTIENLTRYDYDTFEFNAVSNAVYTRIRVDNRTGLNYNNFVFKNHDVVNVTGVASVYNSVYQVKPRGPADIVPEHVTDADAVAIDQAALTIGLTSGDTLTSITGNLTLPLAGANGSIIAWQTTDPAVVTAGGVVSRPSIGQADQQVTLTATLTKGAANSTRSFIITVKANVSTATVTPIATARTLLNTTVTVEGVVTADNSALGGGKLSTYMQDDTAGINLYKDNAKAPVIANLPDLKEGDRVRATGKIIQYRNLTELEITEISVISSGNPLPAPKQVTIADLQNAAAAENLEGQLVTLKAYAGTTNVSLVGGGYNIPVIDSEFRMLTMRVMEGTNVFPGLQSQKWYDVTAIVNQFDNTYQLLPRKPSDVVLSTSQPAIAQTVDSTIGSVVDGDTVHLTTRYLGTDTIRFVNIDTPETYHMTGTFDANQIYSGTSETAMDNNQKAHGERAKAYLKSLLPVGEPVTLQFGVEMMDGNGRILGEIIRKSDGMNINLEMVKQGKAATYYIWPIEEAGYPKYVEAEKEAIRMNRGIWNPADPVTELPFVFRARDEGKELSRPTANWDTKTYVTPANYAQVPVEYRVYFPSELEAQQNGYTPAASTAPVSNLANTAIGTTTADFSFTAPAGAAAVKIQQSKDNGRVYDDAQTAAPLTASSTAASVVGLESGTAYLFKLVVSGGTHAGYSNTVSAATNVIAAPIHNLTVVGVTYSTAEFSFRAPTGATVVHVTYSTDQGATWSSAATTTALDAASTMATVKDLTASTAYKFRVEVAGGPYAGNSNVVEVTTSEPPATPIRTMSYKGFTSHQVTLGFPAPSGATVVKMTYSADLGVTWTEAPVVLDASSVTAQVNGLEAAKRYQFKLVVTGGSFAGESNVVTVYTNAVAAGAALFTETFAQIASWTNDFASGVGAERFRKASNAANSTVNGTSVFVTNTSGGVQKGTESIVLLATGTNSSAFDMVVDLTGKSNAAVSYDWAQVSNSTGDRNSTLKLQYSIDNRVTFVDVTGYTMPVITNQIASSGTAAVALPEEVNNKSTVYLRFYAWNNGDTTGSGSRPKFNIDNISVSAQ